MTKEILIPDIGSNDEVTVIEISVKAGDKVTAEQSLLTLESEKASMEIPSPDTGMIEAIHVKVGDKVKTGSIIGTLKIDTPSTSALTLTPIPTAISPESVNNPATEAKTVPLSLSVDTEKKSIAQTIHASPAVRRLARELEIDLCTLIGSGKKNRIQKSDLLSYISQSMRSQPSPAHYANMPIIDFSQFGLIESKPLSKIKKLTGANLHRNWVAIPHVTQFDQADITELEKFRKSQAEQGLKLTPLVFIMKAIVSTLKQFPQFNASLDSTGENLIFKKYFHLGIAVDTPEGLVVPVIFNVDKKSLSELATEIAELSQKARQKQLLPKNMQGSSFTISSLGGIGGTAFTPIVNFPNVAILGVSKAMVQPVYQDHQFIPRLMLPLSLSYDHRVIDGAEGARFITQLSKYLSNIHLLLL